MLEKSDLIKKTALSQEETTLLREKFIVEYAKKKGWNPSSLNTTQMLEITSQNEFKTPGLILG